MTCWNTVARPALKAIAGVSLGSLLLTGCLAANDDPVASYLSYKDPAVRDRLQVATDRYFECIYRAVDTNIRFAPADENRNFMQAAVDDCRPALKQLSVDVAQLNIKDGVARDLVGSAERHGYAIAREGLRRYFDNGGKK